MANNEYTKGGDVNVSEVTLTRLSDGYSQSIKPQVKEIIIYESLFSHMIHGQILLYDAIGLYNTFPIVGEEKLNIKYAIPDQNEIPEIEIEAHLFSIEAIDNDDSNFATAYVAKFVSLEKKLDVINSVTNPYSLLVSDMVKRIVKDHLNSSKKVNVEDSFGEQKVVFPNVSPTTALDYCTKKAVSQTNISSSYVFYESLDQQFFFKTIEQIIREAKQNKIQSYTLSPQEFLADDGNGSARDIDFTKINVFSPKKRFNTLRKFKDGLLDSELVQFDIITKKQSSTKYSYRDMFNKVEHVDDRSSGKMLTDDFLKQHESISQFDATRAEYSYMIKDSSRPASNITRSYGFRKMYLASLQQNLLTAVLPGNPLMRSGQMIKIDIPIFSGTTDGLKNDNYITDNFLITSTKTVISGESAYSITVDLCKDSYLNGIDLKGIL